MWKPSKKLPREDWYFETCPDNCLYHCFVYEYCRHIQSVIDAFDEAKAHRKEKRAVGATSYFNKKRTWRYPFLMPPLKEGDKVQALVLHAPPGFPSKPYLLTKHKDDGLNRLHPFIPNQNPLRALRKRADSRYIFLDNQSPCMVRIYQDGQTSPLIYADTLTHDQIHHFAIDWSFPKGKIVKAFQKWVENNDPKMSQPNIDSARHLADLRALGAYRLLQAFDTQSKAQDFSENEHQDAGKIAVPLFSNPPEWTRAKDRAEEILADFGRQIPFSSSSVRF